MPHQQQDYLTYVALPGRFCQYFSAVCIMMTSSNGNIFHVTGYLSGEFTGHRCFFPHNGQWHGALMLSLICALDKRLSKHSRGWWIETPVRSLWRHCNDYVWRLDTQPSRSDYWPTADSIDSVLRTLGWGTDMVHRDAYFSIKNNSIGRWKPVKISVLNIPVSSSNCMNCVYVDCGITSMKYSIIPTNLAGSF